MQVKISKKTGLIELYKIDGTTLIENSGELIMFNDNEDPWGMTVDDFKDLDGKFTLMSDKEANEFVGYPEEKLTNVRIVEDGKVRTKVQAFFRHRDTIAAVEYTLPKEGAYIDVNFTIYSNTPNKMIKYRIDTTLKGTPRGETAFGEQDLYNNGMEDVFHKWCGIRAPERSLYVINNGTYGGSFTESSVSLSLLRTPVHSAHPISDRQIAPHNRMLSHIDMGERRFSFRITADEGIEKQAQIFNEAPFLMSFFPSGDGEKSDSVIKIDNPDIMLSSIRNDNGKFTLHLHNFADKESTATVEIIPTGKKMELTFGKYELKFVEIG